MTEKPIVVVYKESLLEGILSDATTFGLLGLCIWASQGSTWWTFVTGVMFLLFGVGVISTAFTRGKRLYSTKELRDLADRIDREKQ